ncbi:MAG: RecX family transcriptional regulator [Coriobacteriia bacterium]|nr:RecX family transcriptional regulator [Coriobacteriia bacterium]
MDPRSAVVTGIRQHGRGSRRRTLYLDGDEWTTLPVEVLRDLDLREDDVVDTSELTERIASIAPVRARERALRLLMYRERSSFEITKRLSDDGYPEDVASLITEDLLRTGLVDDERFAESYARALIQARGYGRSRALRELSARGIAPELALSALEELAPDDGEDQRARVRARSLVRPNDTVDRLAARLIRRGFSQSVALRAARDTLTAILDESPPEDGT